MHWFIRHHTLNSDGEGPGLGHRNLLASLSLARSLVLSVLVVRCPQGCIAAGDNGGSKSYGSRVRVPFATVRELISGEGFTEDGIVACCFPLLEGSPTAPIFRAEVCCEEQEIPGL